LNHLADQVLRFRIEQLNGSMSVESRPGAGALPEAITPAKLAATEAH